MHSFERKVIHWYALSFQFCNRDFKCLNFSSDKSLGYINQVFFKSVPTVFLIHSLSLLFGHIFRNSRIPNQYSASLVLGSHFWPSVLKSLPDFIMHFPPLLEVPFKEFLCFWISSFYCYSQGFNSWMFNKLQVYYITDEFLQLGISHVGVCLLAHYFSNSLSQIYFLDINFFTCLSKLFGPNALCFTCSLDTHPSGRSDVYTILVTWKKYRIFHFLFLAISVVIQCLFCFTLWVFGVSYGIC